MEGECGDVEETVRDEKKNKADLNLCGKDGEVVALWQRWRNSGTLGDVMMFEVARGKDDMEMVMMSCIRVISAETATGLNSFVGLGKT